jgi:hypothetical protein
VGEAVARGADAYEVGCAPSNPSEPSAVEVMDLCRRLAASLAPVTVCLSDLEAY